MPSEESPMDFATMVQRKPHPSFRPREDPPSVILRMRIPVCFTRSRWLITPFEQYDLLAIFKPTRSQQILKPGLDGYRCDFSPPPARAISSLAAGHNIRPGILCRPASAINKQPHPGDPLSFRGTSQCSRNMPAIIQRPIKRSTQPFQRERQSR